MLGNFGFSYVGLIYLLMLFIPNIIWSKNIPTEYDAIQENKVLLLLERIGQVLCTCIVLVFTNFNISVWNMWNIWLIISFIMMVIYEIAWVRYFKNKPTCANFYRSLWGIPVPLAILPVLSFLLLGIYGKVIWLIIAAIILGVGHIGIHLQHIQALKKKGTEI